MPPRKKVDEGPPPPIPTDAELGDALRALRVADEANRAAYRDYMAARERVVAILRAAGVNGFSSI